MCSSLASTNLDLLLNALQGCSTSSQLFRNLFPIPITMFGSNFFHVSIFFFWPSFSSNYRMKPIFPSQTALSWWTEPLKWITWKPKLNDKTNNWTDRWNGNLWLLEKRLSNHNTSYNQSVSLLTIIYNRHSELQVPMLDRNTGPPMLCKGNYSGSRGVFVQLRSMYNFLSRFTNVTLLELNISIIYYKFCNALYFLQFLQADECCTR